MNSVTKKRTNNRRTTSDRDNKRSTQSRNRNKKTQRRTNTNSKIGLHRKKSQVKRNKIIITSICLILALFIVGFIGKKTVGFVSSVWPNIVSLKDSMTGGKIDKTDVNSDEQYDVDDENKATLQKKHNVFIDVGCGGYETGYVTSSKTKEKDLNLQIAKKVAKLLSKYDDINVILSRKEDVYMSPDERKSLAESENAEVFVSIHMAAENTGKADGVETIYSSKSDDGSYDLASIIQTSIAAYIDANNRGVSDYNMKVLEDTAMPSVYIQCGFLSNSSEEKKLKNKDYQDDLSEGIAQGIMTYIDAKK